MLSVISRFYHGDQASVGIIFALKAIPIIFIAGAAVDLGLANTRAELLQIAADQAAIAAATTNTTVELRTAIANDQVRSVTASTPFLAVATPLISVESGQLTITVNAAMPTSFVRILGYETIRLTKKATAAFIISTSGNTYGRACVLALESSATGVSTNTSTLNANCGLYVNSSSPAGLDANGNSVITTSFTCVANNFDKDSGAVLSPAPIRGCAAMDDPFALSLPAPANANASCNFTKKKASGGSLSPGVYCEGLEVESGKTVTLNEGIYIIRNGQFKIGSNANVTGTNVLFYLAGANSTFDFGSSATVKLKGLTEATGGNLKGMLIWNPTQNSASDQHKFSCSSASFLEGVIYSPKTRMEIGSSGLVNASADWTLWVVKTLEMGSSAGLKLETRFSPGATPMPQAIEAGGLQYLLASGTTAISGVRLIK